MLKKIQRMVTAIGVAAAAFLAVPMVTAAPATAAPATSTLSHCDWYQHHHGYRGDHWGRYDCPRDNHRGHHGWWGQQQHHRHHWHHR